MNANLTSVAAVPATMTELLQMAIEDGQALDRSIYHPHYNHWCRIFDGQCFVCAAGAVLISRLSYSADEIDGVFSRGGISLRWQSLLSVVDFMRIGKWANAAQKFYDGQIKGFDKLFADRLHLSMLRSFNTNDFIEGLFRCTGAKYPRDSADPIRVRHIVRIGMFDGWVEYDAWLEYAETLLLPVLQHNEREMLKVAAHSAYYGAGMLES